MNTPQNCGTCKHSAYRDSDREYMHCRFPLIPAAYSHGIIESSDGCHFAGIHKTAGTNCQCYAPHDIEPNPLGAWCVMKCTRTISSRITTTPAEIVARFSDEKAAVIHRDILRANEETRWSDNGVPFVIYSVQQLGWSAPA